MGQKHQNIGFGSDFSDMTPKAQAMKGERQGEKHQWLVASCAPPTGDMACNSGMCPDWESNQQPFGSQAGVQSTEPHQPGQEGEFLLPE